MVHASALRRLTLSVACAALVLAPLQLLSPAATADSPTPPPAPGSLTRFLSSGDTESALGEYIGGFYTSEPDGSDAAPLLVQRPYTDADSNAGLQRPNIERAAVSPDGLHVAVWVRDPDGFVVPGGTPQDSMETENRRTGEVLALFEANGTFVRVLVANRQLTPYQDVYDHFGGISWVDSGHVLVSAARVLFAGTDAETTRSVLHAVEVSTGDVAKVYSVQDGTPAGPYTERGWAGGGTVMAMSNRMGYVFHPGEGQVELPKALVTDDGTHEGYEEASVSPDGQHIAVTYRGERTETGAHSLLDIFDRTAPGTWTRRSIPVPGELESPQVTWLPYDDFADAEVLVDLRADPGSPSVAAALRVGPSSSGADRLARTYPALQGSWAWQPVVVPSAGASDVSMLVSDNAAVAGRAWTGTVTLTGRGPDPSTGIRLELTIDGEPASGLSIAGGACAAGACSVPDLAPGESAVVSISGTLDATGVRSLVATVSSESPDWNPGNDGKLAKVRVLTPEAPGVAGRLIYQSQNGGAIVSSNPDGSARTVLVTPGAGETVDLHEVHHRTGLFLWSRDRADGSREYVVSTLAGQQVRSHAVSSIPLDFAVSPDGRTAYYVELEDMGGPENYDDRFRLCELRLDLPGASPRVRQQWSGSVGKNLRVSPDGTRLAYVVQPIGDYIQVAVATDLDFRTPVVLNPGVAGQIRPNDTPAWSPDSATVALSVGTWSPYSPEGEVLAFALDDAEHPTTLGTVSENLWLGDWSPDGSQLILTDLDSSSAMDASTGQVTALLDRPAWWTGQPVDGSTATPTPTPTTTATPSTTATPTPTPTSTPTTTIPPAPVAPPAPAPASIALPPVAPGDTTPPTVSISLPACGSRKGRECTDYVNRPQSWSRIRGTVRDLGGAGSPDVVVSLVQKRGKTWYAYTGNGWSAKGSAAKAVAAAKSAKATVSGSTWMLKVKGVREGKLVISAVASDKAGNRAEDSYSRTLR